MPQPLVPKKLKLNASVNTYKTFYNSHQKRCPFHHRELECKSRKSRDTWSNRHLATKWSRTQAKTEFCEENGLVIANSFFQQHKRWLYTWTSPDGQYRNKIDFILCSQRWRSKMVEEESEKADFKLNIQKMKIMASSPSTSWQINGETVETVTGLIFLSSKSTMDSEWSHEIKRCLLLERKAMTNLDSILKSRDIALPTKAHIVKAMVFLVVS